VIDYLNNGQDRSRVKIADLEFFGHSNKACWLFDYSNIIDSSSKVWLHENELGKIRRGIFARGALVKSWSCHTGESEPTLARGHGRKHGRRDRQNPIYD